MDFNYLPIASLKSGYIKEDFINKLQISDYFSTLFTINNTVEKYYQQVNTVLSVDDYSNLYIRFIKPNMITSENELNFYKLISYIPLTKKYLYKFISSTNYEEDGDYITTEMTFGVYNYKYNKDLAQNYLSNVHVYDQTWIDSLAHNTNITIKLHFKNITDAQITSSNINNILKDVINKMNCILFDDIVIYEKIKDGHNLEFFITKKLYSPIVFKYNNLLFAENDKIAKPYKTIVQKNGNVAEFTSAISNQILYDDIVYSINAKGGKQNDFHFMNYSNILPLEITDTGINDGIYNNLSNKNYLQIQFFFNSYNILNSKKFKNILFNNNEFNEVINYLTPVLHLDYGTALNGNNVILTLKYQQSEDTKNVKEFTFQDRETKYNSIMTNWYENNSKLFLSNAINTNILSFSNKDDDEGGNLEHKSVSIKTYTPISYINDSDSRFDIYDNMQSVYSLNNPCGQTNHQNKFYEEIYTSGTSDPLGNYNAPKNLIFNIDIEEICVFPENKFNNIRTTKFNVNNSVYTQESNINEIQCGYGFNNKNEKDVITSTTMSTGLTKDMDEFTASFSFAMKEVSNNTFFQIGDFFKVNNNKLSVLSHNVGTFDTLFQQTRQYYAYSATGQQLYPIMNSNNGVVEQTIFVTIRLNYGNVVFDMVNVTPNTDYTFNYIKTRKTWSFDLKNSNNVNVSDILIKLYNESEYQTIRIDSLDFKDRFVEDFILYDFQTEQRKAGSGNLISLY